MVHTMLRHAFNRYRQPKRWFRLAVDIARGVQGWQLEYQDPTEAAQLVAQRLV